MLKSLCNDKKDQFIKVLTSFMQCEIDSGITKHMLQFDAFIERIITQLIAYRSDFSKLVKQDIKKAAMIFLQICEIGSVYLLEYLVDCHGDALNTVQYSTTKRGANGLHLAVKRGHFATVDFLLKRVYFPNNDFTNPKGKGILNQATKHRKTPVHHATAWQDLNIFKLLVEYKCNMTPPKQNDWFPMLKASATNDVAMLKYMIDNNIGTNTINTKGSKKCYTPLFKAITNNNPQAVRILTSFDKTDIDTIKCVDSDTDYSKDNVNVEYTSTALEYAGYTGNGTILRILLRALLKQHNVSDWSSLKQARIDTRIRQLKILANTSRTSNQYRHHDPCIKLLDDLLEKGLGKNDYKYIASTLRYDIPALIENGGDDFILPNKTIIVDHKYRYQLNQVCARLHSKKVGRWWIGEVLGRGAFGDVFKGTDIYNRQEVALKQISMNKLSKNSKSRKTRIASFIMNELETLEFINHKNVIKLLACNLNVDNKGTILLVFEYAQFGELYLFLAINKYFNNSIAKTFFEQILNALETCHAIGIIHRDLKPQNILVDSKYQVKVADFGLSTFDNDLNNKNALYIGTRGYMSPEISSPMIDSYDDETDEPIYKDIDSSCDVFSLGVILWQLLNGIESMPFDESLQCDPKYVYIVEKEFNLFWKCHYNCRIVKKSSNENVQDLLLQMFTFIPQRRISINNIRKHPWYKNVKGYNNSEESQEFFQNTMRKIHRQLNQLEQIKSIRKYESSDISSSRLNNAHAKLTTFEREKLRYDRFVFEGAM